MKEVILALLIAVFGVANLIAGKVYGIDFFVFFGLLFAVFGLLWFGVIVAVESLTEKK